MLIIMKMRPKKFFLRVISNPEDKKNCMWSGGGGGGYSTRFRQKQSGNVMTDTNAVMRSDSYHRKKTHDDNKKQNNGKVSFLPFIKWCHECFTLCIFSFKTIWCNWSPWVKANLESDFSCRQNMENTKFILNSSMNHERKRTTAKPSRQQKVRLHGLNSQTCCKSLICVYLSVLLYIIAKSPSPPPPPPPNQSCLSSSPTIHPNRSC